MLTCPHCGKEFPRRFAVAHPGKMGDLLYAMPVVQALAKKHGCQADFYTSKYCEPLKPLLEYQPEIARVIIPENYEITGYGQGVQPWKMPVNPDGYEAVYQLGVSKWPDKGFIEFYGEQVGIRPEPYHISAPDPPSNDRPIVVAACQRTRSRNYAQAVVDRYKGRFPVVQVGWVGQGLIPGVSNESAPDFLETAAILRGARVFAGGTGANSVLAIAFHPMPCVIAYPGQAFDDRHLVPAPWVKYMKDPTIDEFLRAVEERL